MRNMPVFCLAALLAASSAAMADQETKVDTPDGGSVTVRSDEYGTTVRNEGRTEGATGVTPLQQQHQERVQEIVKDGGVVREQKNTTR